eukprot:9771620-Karenia_brevis.AAC.1
MEGIYYLKEHGATTSWEVLKLAKMKPRYMIVVDDFLCLIDKIVSSLSRSARGNLNCRSLWLIWNGQ